MQFVQNYLLLCMRAEQLTWTWHKSLAFGNRNPWPFLQVPFFLSPVPLVIHEFKKLRNNQNIPPSLKSFVGSCWKMFASNLHNVWQFALQLTNHKKVQTLDFIIWLVRSHIGLSRSARGPSSTCLLRSFVSLGPLIQGMLQVKTLVF